MSRFARAVDSNHAEIVATFRALGCVVTTTAPLGKGFPDLAVLHRKRVRLVEVKDGRKVPSARKRTPLEVAFALLWPVDLVECREDAVEAVNRWTLEAA